jgi:sugar phosphate isomerase/epimerase
VKLSFASAMLDTFHIYHRQDEVRESLAQAGDRLVHVHLADLERDAPGTHHDFTDVISRRETHPDALLRAGLAHRAPLLKGTHV